MKILVAQTIFLGDLVLTLPLIQKLKKELPGTTIDVLVNQKNESLLTHHPAVDRVILFDKKNTHHGFGGLMRLVRELREEQYDVAIVLPGSVRTALAIWIAKIPRRIGSDQSTGMMLFADRLTFLHKSHRTISSKFVYYVEKVLRSFGTMSMTSPLFTDIIVLDKQKHASLRYMDLAKPFGIKLTADERLFIAVREKDRKVVDVFLAEYQPRSELIALAPGSIWSTKRWPAEYFAEFIKQFRNETTNRSIVMIGGEGDRDLCKSITEITGPSQVLLAAGRFSPTQSAELLRRCRVLISNDSAAMHLASAVGTPVVAIFGPTIPEFGFTPLGEKNVIVERTGLWCRPCTPHGGDRCPIGTHECMRGLSVKQVRQAVETILTRT